MSKRNKMYFIFICLITLCMINTSADLIAYFGFEEGSGTTANDLSDYNNDGSLVNMSESGWVTGKVGNYALDFDGVNDYVDAGSDSSLDVVGNVTLSAWIYLRKDDGHVGIIDMATEGTTNENYSIITGWNSSFPMGFQFNNNGWQSLIFSTGFYTTNEWFHVAVTYNNGTITAYKNGTFFQSSSGHPDLMVTTSNVLKLGRYQVGGTGYFDGQLDDVGVWNEALSATNISDIYTNGIASFASIAVPELSNLLTLFLSMFSFGIVRFFK